MLKRNILIIVDKNDLKHIRINQDNDNWNAAIKIIDYNNLYHHLNDTKQYIINYKVDFIVYSRNNQIGNKIKIGPFIDELKIGYTTVSGIDQKFWVDEMKLCYNDFMKCNNQIEIKLNNDKYNTNIQNMQGTFTLIFDTEQVGCVRYGLPRLLNLLDKYDIKATFFVTNIMKKVYNNIVEEIIKQGHEIGLHGQWHEDISNQNLSSQIMSIKSMKEDFKIDVKTANFIGRMNKDTIDALMENRIESAVYPLINSYRRTCYPKYPTHTTTIKKGNKYIHMIPVLVETYDHPWFSIKNMIDSACLQSKKYNKHITILCHPFRDGNLQNIETTENLMKYLIYNKKLSPIKISEIPEDYKNCIDINDHIMDNKKNEIINNFLPCTIQDYMGIIPQNLISIYRVLNKNKTIW